MQKIINTITLVLGKEEVDEKTLEQVKQAWDTHSKISI